MTRPPTPEQLQTLRDLRERIRAMQDEAHDLRYPEGSNSKLAGSIRFGGDRLAYGIEDGFAAVCAMLSSLQRQVEALADNALEADYSSPWERAKARARSLPPERDEPDGEGDASHTVPALATVKGAR